MSLSFNTTRIEALEDKIRSLERELSTRKANHQDLKEENNRLQALLTLNIKSHKEAQAGDFVCNRDRDIRRICDVVGTTVLFNVKNGEITEINQVFLEFAKNKPKTLETVKQYMELEGYI